MFKVNNNLIKANQAVLKEDEVRVIDSNKLVAEKIQTLSAQLPKEGEGGGFQSGISAVHLEAIPEEMMQEGEELAVEGAVSLEVPAPAAVYSGPSAEELIAEAREQIEEMKRQAESEIEAMRECTMEEWRQQGYRDGQKQALEELEKDRLALKQQAARLEEEYQEKIDRLEPEFVEVLTGIYEQIFKVELVEYRPVLLNTISNSIRNIEGGRDFIVHVSKADYEEVLRAKEEIFARLASTSGSLEVVEDITLGPNECMIETSNGIYDCGIGSQLEELTRRLRLLSYEK